MHVLHLETGRRLYGGARQVLYLADGLGPLGVRSSLVCAAGGALEQEAADRGIDVISLPVPCDTDPRLLFRMGALIRRLKPDLVHLHSRRGADTWGLLAARLAERPVVLSRRVDSAELPLVGHWKYRLAQRVIAISAGVAEQLRREGVPEHKLRIVRSAVAARDWQPAWSTERFLDEFGLTTAQRPIAMVAQLIPRKGHRLMLAALADLRDSCPDARVVLFGRGRLERQLRTETAAAGLQDMVRFAGFRDDLRNYLGHFELLLHPASREGLGVALLEAQAAGLPVVGLKVPGVTEAVADGISGLLVPPGDSAALAAAMLRLLANPRYRTALGAAARQRVRDEFGIEAMLRGNLAVYREILGAGVLPG